MVKRFAVVLFVMGCGQPVRDRQHCIVQTTRDIMGWCVDTREQEIPDICPGDPIPGLCTDRELSGGVSYHRCRIAIASEAGSVNVTGWMTSNAINGQPAETYAMEQCSRSGGTYLGR